MFNLRDIQIVKKYPCITDFKGRKTDMDNLNFNLADLICVVKSAKEIMLKDDFEIKEKSGISNIVTSNDIRVQEFLIEQLSRLLPQSGFLVEEEDANDTSKDYIWIIDPIDGTTNYSRHINVCCISVALTYKGEAIMGVVYNPYQEIIFYGEKGKGSYLNGKRIHVSNKRLKEAILYSSFSAYDKSRSHQMFNMLESMGGDINDIRRTGSAALEICLVAAGLGDLYIEYNLYPWDIAGASVILKEAGGFICSKGLRAVQGIRRPTRVS